MTRHISSSSYLRWSATIAVLIGAAMAPAARADCLGDCDGTDTVEVIELVIGVNIALGQMPLIVCPVWDGNGDGRVDVSELQRGIDETMYGCPAATPAPSRCGDGLITDQEQCDDGNTTDGDGCSATCTVEGPTVVDQIWDGCTGSGGSININFAAPTGQEFIPNATRIAAVAVRISRQVHTGSDHPSLTARLHAGTIDAPVLGESIHTVGADGPVLFAFQPQVAVTPGAVYVLELATSSPALSWERGGSASSCTYDRGRPIYFGQPLLPDDGEDQFFITFGAP